MIYSMPTGEYYSGVIQNGNSLLPEFFWRNTFNLDEGTKYNLDIMVAFNIKIR